MPLEGEGPLHLVVDSVPAVLGVGGDGGGDWLGRCGDDHARLGGRKRGEAVESVRVRSRARVRKGWARSVGATATGGSGGRVDDGRAEPRVDRLRR